MTRILPLAAIKTVSGCFILFQLPKVISYQLSREFIFHSQRLMDSVWPMENGKTITACNVHERIPGENCTCKNTIPGEIVLFRDVEPELDDIALLHDEK